MRGRVERRMKSKKKEKRKRRKRRHGRSLRETGEELHTKALISRAYRVALGSNKS